MNGVQLRNILKAAMKDFAWHKTWDGQRTFTIVSDSFMSETRIEMYGFYFIVDSKTDEAVRKIVHCAINAYSECAIKDEETR